MDIWIILLVVLIVIAILVAVWRWHGSSAVDCLVNLRDLIKELKSGYYNGDVGKVKPVIDECVKCHYNLLLAGESNDEFEDEFLGMLDKIHKEYPMLSLKPKLDIDLMQLSAVQREKFQQLLDSIDKIENGFTGGAFEDVKKKVYDQYRITWEATICEDATGYADLRAMVGGPKFAAYAGVIPAAAADPITDNRNIIQMLVTDPTGANVVRDSWTSVLYEFFWPEILDHIRIDPVFIRGVYQRTVNDIRALVPNPDDIISGRAPANTREEKGFRAAYNAAAAKLASVERVIGAPNYVADVTAYLARAKAACLTDVTTYYNKYKADISRIKTAVRPYERNRMAAEKLLRYSPDKDDVDIRTAYTNVFSDNASPNNVYDQILAAFGTNYFMALPMQGYLDLSVATRNPVITSKAEMMEKQIIVAVTSQKLHDVFVADLNKSVAKFANGLKKTLEAKFEEKITVLNDKSKKYHDKQVYDALTEMERDIVGVITTYKNKFKSTFGFTDAEFAGVETKFQTDIDAGDSVERVSFELLRMYLTTSRAALNSRKETLRVNLYQMQGDACFIMRKIAKEIFTGDPNSEKVKEYKKALFDAIRIVTYWPGKIERKWNAATGVYENYNIDAAHGVRAPLGAPGVPPPKGVPPPPKGPPPPPKGKLVAKGNP